MDYQLNTRLNGNIAMTSSYHERASLQRDKTLYKFIWVQSGTLTLEIDHISMRLEKDEIVTLTPLHHLEVKEVDGEYLTFVFNSNFIASMDMTTRSLATDSFLWLFQGDETGAFCRAVFQPA